MTFSGSGYGMSDQSVVEDALYMAANFGTEDQMPRNLTDWQKDIWLSAFEIGKKQAQRKAVLN